MTVQPVTETSADRLRSPDAARPGVVRVAVAASATFLVLQVSLTDYGSGARGAGLVWLLLGGVLLWFVGVRRSRAAWLLVVVPSLLGAAVHGAGAFEDARSAVLAVAFLGQAGALLPCRPGLADA